MSDKKDEVIRRYEAGESISKISKNLRINKSLIRSYLRAGFYPDIIDEEHRARWDAIFEIINSDKRV